VVTDQIETFTETGVTLKSGQTIDADIIVTATGLKLQLFGGVAVSVDGERKNPNECLVYKSFMLSGIPNMAFAFGYTNSSWTLKIDLLCEHLCRLLAYMDSRGYATVTPVVNDKSMGTRPMLDFPAGYILRAIDEFPKQGTTGPWTIEMDYWSDHSRLRKGPVEDPALRFGTATPAKASAGAATA
jgi:hypothetical protein